MPTSGDLKSGDTIKDQHPPPPPHDRIRQCDPPSPEIFFFIWTPHQVISRGKNVDLSVRDFNWLNTSSNQTLAYIGVAKKKLPSFCLQRTTCITQENEARNRNTSIRSQMIWGFWNMRSLNLSFCVQLSQLPFYPRVLVTRTTEPGESGRLALYSGDSRIFQESWHM